MEKIDLERYIYKLIPDYAYIDYAEREFWLSHKTASDGKITLVTADEFVPADMWRKIIPLSDIQRSINGSLPTTKIKYGRCLLISPVNLNFVEHEDEIVVELKKYGSRHVYACFSSEDALLRQDFQAYIEMDVEINPDEPYIFEMRF